MIAHGQKDPKARPPRPLGTEDHLLDGDDVRPCHAEPHRHRKRTSGDRRGRLEMLRPEVIRLIGIFMN